MANAIPLNQAHPDPMRAHGAWVYLFASVAAGALVGAGHGVEASMLAGTGFVGAYLVFSGASVGVRRKLRQVLLGVLLAILAPMGALWLSADREFLVVAAAAVLPASAAVALEKKLGFLSKSALITGVTALVMAAPVSAVAGGAAVGRAALLYVLLGVFFCWRTLGVASSLPAQEAWDRLTLRTRGLREAAIAAAWALFVAMCLRIL